MCPEAATTGASSSGSAWVRLGDELLLVGPGDAADRAAAAAGASAVRRRTRRSDVALGRLHLVVQNGRLFQQAHPDVPVIVDKGRYLVVDLDPDRVEALTAHEVPCYTVAPLPRDAVVLEVGRSARRRAPVPWVQDLADSLTKTELEADLRSLVGFPTRLSTSPEFAEAARWAHDRLAAAGFDVRTQPISVGGAPSLNIVADRPGAGSGSRDLVLVTAHLDSINLAGGPAAAAPGADDNGSGSAGLLAIARAFHAHPAVHDLRLILFSGEEQGLHGSRQHVAALAAAERQRVRAVINMDMIATLNTGTPSVLLEGAPLSQSLIDGLAESAATYTALEVQTSLNAANSDHVPFIRKGLPAVLTIEGTDHANANIHSASDTLDFVDYDLALGIVRMNVAHVAQLLGTMEA